MIFSFRKSIFFNIFAVFSAITLTGCATDVGGLGTLTDGSGLVGKLSGSISEGRSVVSVSSPKGWTCTGAYTHDMRLNGSNSIKVPLTCDDGRTGNGIIFFDKHALRMSMAFHLSNGEEGTVTYPFK